MFSNELFLTMDGLKIKINHCCGGPKVRKRLRDKIKDISTINQFRNVRYLHRKKVKQNWGFEVINVKTTQIWVCPLVENKS